jgi:site-specific recombinase XerC
VAHRAAGFESPNKSARVRLVWSGIRREKGTARARMKPALTKHIREMVAHLPDTLLGARDRALILLGFAGAIRRSELVGLDVADVAAADEGLVVVIRKGKTDQEGSGRKLGIPLGKNPATCPVRAVQAWLDLSGVAEGHLFRPVNRHGHVSAGRSARRYTGHSLRAGLIIRRQSRAVTRPRSCPEADVPHPDRHGACLHPMEHINAR